MPRGWVVSVRPGPSANGFLPQALALLPLALVKYPLREVISFAVAPGLVGFPPTMNTKGSLGHSVMTYQSSWVAFNYCEAGRSIRVRIGGRASKRRDASESSLARAAEVGYCPRL